MAFFVNQKIFSCKFADTEENIIACTTLDERKEGGSLIINRYNENRDELIPITTFPYDHGLLDCVWDGGNIITSSSNGYIQYWGLHGDTSEPLKLFFGHKGAATSLKWTKSKDELISGSIDSTIKCWDLNYNAPTTSLTMEDSVIEQASSQLLSQVLSVVMANRKLSHFDLRQPMKAIFQTTEGVLSCDWCPRFPYNIVTGSINGTVSCLDVRFPAQPCQLLVVHQGGVARVRCDPHRRGLVLTAGFDGATALTMKNYTVLERIFHHSHAVYSVDWSFLNPTLVADCSWDSILHVYRPKTIFQVSMSWNKL